MKIEEVLETKNSFELYGLDNYLNNFISLFEKNKFPKILLLTGAKGLGKSTIVNHFLSYVFDKENYNIEKKIINSNAKYLNLYKNNLFENIIYLQGDSINKIKVEDARNLKLKILKKSNNNLPRFIILDDVELFNKNSLNALLKTIEEPSKNNFFILINNLQYPILETIKSRSLETKFFLPLNKRIFIINCLIKKYKLKNIIIDYENIEITPGHFILFHILCEENKIDLNKNYLKNINILIKLFKKTKSRYYILLINFIIENFFHTKIKSGQKNINDLIKERLYVSKTIDNFLVYNLTQNSFINSISEVIHD